MIWKQIVCLSSIFLIAVALLSNPKNNRGSNDMIRLLVASNETSCLCDPPSDYSSKRYALRLRYLRKYTHGSMCKQNGHNGTRTQNSMQNASYDWNFYVNGTLDSAKWMNSSLVFSLEPLLHLYLIARLYQGGLCSLTLDWLALKQILLFSRGLMRIEKCERMSTKFMVMMTWWMEEDIPTSAVMMPHRKHPNAAMCVLSYLSPRIPLTGELSACTASIWWDSWFTFLTHTITWT